MKNINHLLTSNSSKIQRGQALLVVVMVMVVALTVGLSIAIRTTISVRTSSEDENSERAFSAAEAGIEQAFLNNTSIPLTSLENNSTYQTSVVNFSGAALLVNNGTSILKDEPVDIWLSNYPDYSSPWSGSLIINWGAASDTCSPSEANNTQAALEVVVLTGTVASPRSTTYALDPCPARAATNNFELVSTAGSTVDGKSFSRQRTINVASGLIARITPLYAGTDIGIQKGGADPNFPSQGIVVTSTGVSDTTQRKIVSFRAHPKLPAELFPYIFFSP